MPLSDNRALSKELGTRHRAALGVSEHTDALVIAVSEETGYISTTRDGVLTRNMGIDSLQEQLVQFQNNELVDVSIKTKKLRKWKGLLKHEGKGVK